MVPLRRYLIVREHGNLPYPEGTACAEVLIASETGGSRAQNVFLGLGLGALFKGLTGWLRVLPGEVEVNVPFLKKGQVGCDVSAALFGVGYILGYRIGGIMVAGGLLATGVALALPDWPAVIMLPAVLIAGLILSFPNTLQDTLSQSIIYWKQQVV